MQSAGLTQRVVPGRVAAFIAGQRKPAICLRKEVSGFAAFKMAGEEGLEPTTPGFGDRYSNQIELHSYVTQY